MRTIYILKGLPGCGKSTFARELLKKESTRWKRINLDDLRLMLDDAVYSRENEEFIRSLQDKLIISTLNDGYDVIIDNTHLVQTTVKKLHSIAESIGDVMVLEKGFNVSVEECIKRNATRTGLARVPDDVIMRMARSSGLDRGKYLKHSETYYPPRDGFTKIDQDESLPKAILCDLDGTLALIGNRSPYDATDCDVKDKPNWPVINCVLAMYERGMKVIFMSGRDSKYRPETIRFIESYCLRNNKENFFVNGKQKTVVEPIRYQLYMRGEGDQRKDSIIKRELFDAHVSKQFNVEFVLDDRNQVVDTWRSMGLTCFQVAPGAF